MKAFIFGLSFLSVPAMTIFVMSGTLNGQYHHICTFLVVLVILLGFLCIKRITFSSTALSVSLLLLVTFLRSSYVYKTQSDYSARLTESLGDAECVFSGYIYEDDAPSRSGFFVELDSVDGVPLTHSVITYASNFSDHSYAEGTFVEICAKIRRPQNTENFKITGWLSGKGVHSELYSISDIRVDLSKQMNIHTKGLRRIITQSVQKVLRHIPESDTFNDTCAMTDALMFGDKSGFTAEQKDNFTKGGILHLLCVSGLHFSVLLTSFGFVLRYILSNRYTRFIILICIAFLYLALCGFSFSATRAAVMALICALGTMYSNTAKCTFNLLFAVAIISLVDPNSIFDTGFRLSVLSCAGIACSSHIIRMFERKREKHPLMISVLSIALVSLGAFIFTAVYSACAFGGLSFAAIPASVISIFPAELCLILSWISIPVSMLGLSSLEFALGNIISHISDYIFKVAEVFSEIKFLYMEISIPDISLIVFFALLILSAFTLASRVRGTKILFLVFILSWITVIINILPSLL